MRDIKTRTDDAYPPVLDQIGLCAYLASQPDIVAAYLFGSLAQGRATPHSDVDIAVLLTHDASSNFDRQLQIMDDLQSFADRQVDAIILNNAPRLLTHQIFCRGRLIYERDRQARIEFEVRAGKIYADLKPMDDLFRQAMIQELREVGLGGRRHRRI